MSCPICGGQHPVTYHETGLRLVEHTETEKSDQEYLHILRADLYALISGDFHLSNYEMRMHGLITFARLEDTRPEVVLRKLLADKPSDDIFKNILSEWYRNKQNPAYNEFVELFVGIDPVITPDLLYREINAFLAGSAMRAKDTVDNDLMDTPIVQMAIERGVPMSASDRFVGFVLQQTLKDDMYLNLRKLRQQYCSYSYPIDEERQLRDEKNALFEQATKDVRRFFRAEDIRLFGKKMITLFETINVDTTRTDVLRAIDRAIIASLKSIDDPVGFRYFAEMVRNLHDRIPVFAQRLQSEEMSRILSLFFQEFLQTMDLASVHDVYDFHKRNNFAELMGMHDLDTRLHQRIETLLDEALKDHNHLREPSQLIATIRLLPDEIAESYTQRLLTSFLASDDSWLLRLNGYSLLDIFDLPLTLEQKMMVAERCYESVLGNAGSVSNKISIVAAVDSVVGADMKNRDPRLEFYRSLQMTGSRL